ncbi:ImmA/IrrE family metallo-endopeptidase [Thermodesulfobacteriota bacterium]
MNTEEEINTAIKKLIRSITVREIKKQLKWHKTLYEIGEAALPKIRSTIKSYNSSSLDIRSKHICISGLMRLMHDINEQKALSLTKELIENGCDSLIATHLKTINEFTSKNFKCYQIKGVRIYEEKKLSPQYSIQRLLQKWFENVPLENLNEVDRIYVKSKDKQDYSGNYMPIFFSINLVWIAPSSRYNPMFWLIILGHEFTLYHEIGHHVSRHTFGKDPDQEREANQYAKMLMTKRHPLLGALISTLSKTIKRIKIRKIQKEIRTET